MEIYKNLNLKKIHQNSILAIGNFDGVHLGHQKVILQAKSKAKKLKLPFGILTFEPMPVMFFNKKIKNHRINSIEQKKQQLKKFNLDFMIVVKFNKKFSKISAKNFIDLIISKKIKCKFLFVSSNFRFGFKREGNVNTLKRFSKKFGYKIVITKIYKKNSKIVSSSLIRKKISQGKIYEVNNLLNRNWKIVGKVINGKRRGRKIGFPTCNMKMNDYVIPRLGVYAVKIRTTNLLKNGISNIGYRPTFKGQNLLLETNIFGINQNLYDKEIEVNFKKFIRPEKKFKNLEHLKEQIKKDIAKAKK